MLFFLLVSWAAEGRPRNCLNYKDYSYILLLLHNFLIIV